MNKNIVNFEFRVYYVFKNERRLPFMLLESSGMQNLVNIKLAPSLVREFRQICLSDRNFTSSSRKFFAKHLGNCSEFRVRYIGLESIYRMTFISSVIRTPPGILCNFTIKINIEIKVYLKYVERNFETFSDPIK